MKFCFGDIVVVNTDEIGVVCKCWRKSMKSMEPEYEVYCRMSEEMKLFPESKIQRYMVRHKYLDENEMTWQRNSQMQ